MDEFVLDEPESESDVRPDGPSSGDDTLQDELTRYRSWLVQLVKMDSVEVMQTISSVSARLCEIRAYLYQVDSRRSQALRIREVDPLIEECDRQFKIHSRIQSIKEVEYKLSGGQF